MNFRKNREFLERLGALVPGGANSNARCGSSIAVDRAEGAILVDMGGNDFIDYVLGFGPIILGHADPTVTERATSAMKRGTTFAYSHDLELEVAEKIIDLLPSVEMVRFCNSGTEACATAYRLACAVTGRHGAIKVEGDYHGAVDVLMHDTPGVEASLLDGPPVPTTCGLPDFVGELAVTVPFNDAGVLERAFTESRFGIAAVFMEPIQGNCASIMPAPGYLKAVRQLCDRFGALLVFDEIKTGFRVSLRGAQDLLGVFADLTTLGKALGNGFPIAAVGGRRDLMERLRPGEVHHCGTYFGNLPAMAVASCVLDLLGKADYGQLSKLTAELADGCCQRLKERGLPAAWQGAGGMFGITVGPNEPKNYREWWLETDRAFVNDLARELLDLGVLFDGFIGLWFTSFAHSPDQISETLDRVERATERALEKRNGG